MSYFSNLINGLNKKSKIIQTFIVYAKALHIVGCIASAGGIFRGATSPIPKDLDDNGFIKRAAYKIYQIAHSGISAWFDGVTAPVTIANKMKEKLQ